MADTTLSTLGEYLRDLLQGIATVYIGTLPTLDSSGIAVQLYNGASPQSFLGSRFNIYDVNVLIHFRDYSYPIAAGWCDAVVRCLHQFSGDNILGAKLIGGTMYLGTTTEKLHEFQQTYKIHLGE